MCILDQFPEFMTRGTFKSIPFKKNNKENKNEKNVGGESLEAKTRWVQKASKKTVIGASKRHIFVKS